MRPSSDVGIVEAKLAAYDVRVHIRMPKRWTPLRSRADTAARSWAPRRHLVPVVPRWSALYFLTIVVVIVVVGGLVLWAANRQPNSTESSISSFQREMDTLSPKDDTVPPTARNRRRTEER